MARATLLDIAKHTGNDKVVGLIEENLAYAPELSVFFSRPAISGTSYKTITRTAFPSVGFRSANEGVTATKSSAVQKTVECYIFSGRVEVDKAVGMAHEDGMEAYEMYEADGVAKSSLLELGSQIFYGTTNDAKGFPGLKAALPFGSTITVDATGSTANTASSVYAVKFGLKDVCLVPGRGDVLKLSDFRDETIYDASSNPLAGRVADLTGWIGMQIGNSNCVGRILNLTAQTGKGLTDSLLADLFGKFPIGYKPDVLFMSRRSATQLQKSRTVVINANGVGVNGGVANIPARPTEYNGVPIIETDSILDTDAIES